MGFAGRFFSSKPNEPPPPPPNETPKEEQQQQKGSPPPPPPPEEEEEDLDERERRKRKKKVILNTNFEWPKFQPRKSHYIAIAITLGFVAYGFTAELNEDDVRLMMAVMRSPWADSPIFDFPDESKTIIPAAIRARVIAFVSFILTFYRDLSNKDYQAENKRDPAEEDEEMSANVEVEEEEEDNDEDNPFVPKKTKKITKAEGLEMLKSNTPISDDDEQDEAIERFLAKKKKAMEKAMTTASLAQLQREIDKKPEEEEKGVFGFSSSKGKLRPGRPCTLDEMVNNLREDFFFMKQSDRELEKIPFVTLKGEGYSSLGEDISPVRITVLLSFNDFFRKVRDPVDPFIFRYVMRDNAGVLFDFLKNKVDIFFWLDTGNLEEEKRIDFFLRNALDEELVTGVIRSNHCDIDFGRRVRDLARLPMVKSKLLVITAEDRDYPRNKDFPKILLGKWNGEPDDKLLDLLFFFDNILHVDFHPSRNLPLMLRKFYSAGVNPVDYWRPVREHVWGTGPGIVIPPEENQAFPLLAEVDYFVTKSPDGLVGEY